MTDLAVARPRVLAAVLLLTAVLACSSAEPGGEVVSPAPALPDGAPDPTAAAVPSEPDGAASSTASWAALPPAPVALTEVAGAAHAGEIWTAGGLGADGQAVATVQRFSPTTGEWGFGPELPQAVHHAALVSTGGTLLLLGGYLADDLAMPTDEVWVLAEEEVGWQPAAPLPEARAAGAAAFSGEVVLYGGGVGPAGLAGDVWLGGADGWTAAGVLGQPREHLAAAGTGGVVWFLGGRTGGLETNLGHVDVARVTGPGSAQLTALGEVLPPAGGVAGFAHPDGRGCMAGGEAPEGTIATVVCVDAEGAVTELPDLRESRHGLAAAVVDGQALVVLGGPEPGLFVTDAGESLPLS